MGRRVRSQHPPPNNLYELRQSLIRVWEDIAQESAASMTGLMMPVRSAVSEGELRGKGRCVDSGESHSGRCKVLGN
ncbi:hypothetical protein ILUMI_22244 [Ignelater luminosus]|uniref:Uncharacterized protein n=1 Tax=Ignelater luminosus TaxID=2038154 RepID=A0A8K0CH44_IGNLU|nr:hypothetical protein ILUMI_22244 [Ignelater luminosus]